MHHYNQKKKYFKFFISLYFAKYSKNFKVKKRAGHLPLLQKINQLHLYPGLIHKLTEVFLCQASKYLLGPTLHQFLILPKKKKTFFGSLFGEMFSYKTKPSTSIASSINHLTTNNFEKKSFNKNIRVSTQ